jgi:hypothetical protein
MARFAQLRLSYLQYFNKPLNHYLEVLLLIIIAIVVFYSYFAKFFFAGYISNIGVDQ